MSLPVNALAVSAVVKEATHSLHTEVENLLMPKLSSVQTLADYAAILQLFYGYFSPLENNIQQHITKEQLPDIGERRKAAAILHDLEVIGYPAQGLETCHRLQVITTSPQAFGALYVLEGSTLGGKMIAKMLLKNKAISLPEDALTFFSGYGDNTGTKWKTFLEVLNRQGDTDEIATAANDTFYYLKSWMQHTLYND